MIIIILLTINIAGLENDDSKHPQSCTYYEASHGEHNGPGQIVRHSSLLTFHTNKLLVVVVVVVGGGGGHEISLSILYTGYHSLQLYSGTLWPSTLSVLFSDCVLGHLLYFLRGSFIS